MIHELHRMYPLRPDHRLSARKRSTIRPPRSISPLRVWATPLTTWGRVFAFRSRYGQDRLHGIEAAHGCSGRRSDRCQEARPTLLMTRTASSRGCLRIRHNGGVSCRRGAGNSPCRPVLQQEGDADACPGSMETRCAGGGAGAGVPRESRYDNTTKLVPCQADSSQRLRSGRQLLTQIECRGP